MNKLLLLPAILSLLIVMPSANALSATIATNADTYIYSPAPTTNYGTAASFADGDNNALQGVVKFNLTNLLGDNYVTSAKLYLYKYVSSNPGVSNETIWSSENQTWAENKLTWNETYDTTTGIGRVASNFSYVTYNESLSGANPNQWYTFDVTNTVNYFISRGKTNVTFLLNMTGLLPTHNNYNSSQSGINWPQLNVTYVPIIDIISPVNTTYYNNYNITLNVQNNSINIYNWWYNYNNQGNVSFLNGSSINVNTGSNCIVVWLNSTANVWVNKSVCFTNAISCDSTTENSSICTVAGDSFVRCKRFGLNIYQWDYDNTTSCVFGCNNGNCLVPTTTCRDNCNVGESRCDGSDFLVNCTYSPVTGCNEWSTRSQCQFGCTNDQCNHGINLCSPYTMHCSDNYVEWCLDDNLDGLYAWSTFNRTKCNFQCVENITASNVVAYCTSHSMTDESYAVRQLMDYYGNGIRYMLQNNSNLFIGFSVFACFVVGIGIAWMSKSFMFGGIAMFLTLIIMSSMGMFPWALTFIIFIIGIFLLFYTGGLKEDE
jgi:hypothetical protein